MTPNVLVLAATALIPFAFSFIWYNKSLFGGDNWAEIARISKEENDSPISPVKLVLSLLLNFFVAFGLYQAVVHQSGVFSLVGGKAELLASGVGAQFLAEYGGNFLTFKHGAFHGFICAIVFVLPILSYVTIFERKSGKYLLVNLGFWAISFMLMGGVACQWGGVPIV